MESVSVRAIATAALAVSGVTSIHSAQAQTFASLYNFTNGADGADPRGGVIYQGGTLIGSAQLGGTSGYGTVYSLNLTTLAISVLHTFTGATTDGAYPQAALISQSGTLYGTTGAGGTSNLGTAYSLNPTTGAEAVIYNFAGVTSGDGAAPEASVTYLSGLLYGTTAIGGTPTCGGATGGCGTVFALSPSTGAETVLHSFVGATSDGSAVPAGLVYEGGSFYGTTEAGGTSNFGTVFKINSSTGVETVIHSFTGGTDGSAPWAGLLYYGGALYGTTTAGGASGYGTIYKVDPSTGVESVLYSFTGGSDGSRPYAPLVYGDNTLVGTTEFGGASNFGTAFEFNPSTGIETVLHSFTGSDGANPIAGLTYQGGVAGTFYGTTTDKGAYGYGTIFQVSP